MFGSQAWILLSSPLLWPFLTSLSALNFQRIWWLGMPLFLSRIERARVWYFGAVYSLLWKTALQGFPRDTKPVRQLNTNSEYLCFYWNLCLVSFNPRDHREISYANYSRKNNLLGLLTRFLFIFALLKVSAASEVQDNFWHRLYNWSSSHITCHIILQGQ